MVNYLEVYIKWGELYSKTKLTSPVYLVNKMHKKDLLKYIEYNKYDLVIATHVFPAMALTAINTKNKKVNFIFVATDYECAPFTQEIKPDYLITQKGLKNNFIKKGVKKAIIKEFGIPVSSKFINKAKNIREDLGVKKEKIILMMLGSMGFGKVIGAVNSILTINNIKLVVICGSNEALFETLNNIDNGSLIVKGFINNINDYIYSADIILSKPGGLSSTEIASIGKPLIHIFPIPGVETYNVNYFNSNNMSISCNCVKKLAEVINMLINNEKLTTKMINSQKRFINENAAKDLIEFIKKKYYHH